MDFYNEKVLFHTKATEENEYGYANRWALVFCLAGINWSMQYKHKDSTEWRTCHSSSYGFWFRKHSRWGFEHLYMDGSHCFFDIGYLSIQYNGVKHCEKCYGHGE